MKPDGSLRFRGMRITNGTQEKIIEKKTTLLAFAVLLHLKMDLYPKAPNMMLYNAFHEKNLSSWQLLQLLLLLIFSS